MNNPFDIPTHGFFLCRWLLPKKTHTKWDGPNIYIRLIFFYYPIWNLDRRFLLTTTQTSGLTLVEHLVYYDACHNIIIFLLES